MENGSKKTDNGSHSLSGFCMSGAILIFAAHANIEWLELGGLLGVFIFSWKTAGILILGEIIGHGCVAKAFSRRRVPKAMEIRVTGMVPADVVD